MSDYIQIARIRGTEEKIKINQYTDDFYTLCRKQPLNNLGLRSKGMIIFKTTDTSIDYLCSDFVRFCFSIYKNGQDLDSGCIGLIPKQPIPISEELKEYMKEFLPDYYGIRK